MQWIVQSDKVNEGSWLGICMALCNCVGELEKADSQPSLNSLPEKEQIFVYQNNTAARSRYYYGNLLKMKYTNYVDINKARHQ